MSDEVKKQYAYSFDAEMYYGKFDTKDEAIKEAALSGAYKDADIHIGVIKEVEISNYFDIDNFIDELCDRIDDNDEAPLDDHTEIDVDDKKAMDTEITEIIKHRCKVSHYTIIDTEKIR